MTWLINCVLVMMVIPLVGFIYRYGRYSPWRASWQGITLMSQNIALLSLVSYYLVDAVWGNWAHQRVILAAILIVLLALFWSALVGLLYVQNHQKPVTKRQGTGYVESDDIEKTKP